MAVYHSICIYLERGCILKVRLKSVTSLEMDGYIGTDFVL